MDLRYSFFFLFDPYQIRTDIDSVKRKCTNHYTKRPLFLPLLLSINFNILKLKAKVD